MGVQNEIFLADFQYFEIFFQKNAVLVVTKWVFFSSIGYREIKLNVRLFKKQRDEKGKFIIQKGLWEFVSVPVVCVVAVGE